MDVTETLPVTGRVVEVATYVDHGVVACVTLMGMFVILTGTVADVTT